MNNEISEYDNVFDMADYRRKSPIVNNEVSKHCNVFDTANYIMTNYTNMPEEYGVLSAMKLQKLVYYAQAWSLTWDDEILFDDPIEAWIYGPVNRELFNISRGHYHPQDIENQKLSGIEFSQDQKETMDLVIENYGKFKAGILASMTQTKHLGKKPEKGVGPVENGNAVIDIEDMRKFYSDLEKN